MSGYRAIQGRPKRDPLGRHRSPSDICTAKALLRGFKSLSLKGMIMKVDLLYELQAPMPYSKPFPYGQREAEQNSYYDALEQIQLADKLGYGTAWFVEHHFRIGRSHCPAPEVMIGALSQITKNIRLGFGVTLTPHG